MINILPEEGRKRVAREYAVRLASVCMFLLCALGFITAGMLLPSYFTAQVAAEGAGLAAAHEATLTGGVQSVDETALIRSKNEMISLNTFRDTVVPSGVLQRLTAVLPVGVSLSYIEYQSASAKVILAGSAISRESLLSFVHALEKVKGVGHVDLPLGSLARSENVLFTITATLSK